MNGVNSSTVWCCGGGGGGGADGDGGRVRWKSENVLKVLRTHILYNCY